LAKTVKLLAKSVAVIWTKCFRGNESVFVRNLDFYCL